MQVCLQCKFVIVIKKLCKYANLQKCKCKCKRTSIHKRKQNQEASIMPNTNSMRHVHYLMITMRYLVKSLKQALLQSMKKKQEIVVITNGWTNSLLSFYLQLETRKHFNMFWSTLSTAVLSTIMAARGLWASKRHSWCYKAGPVKCTDCRLSICRLVVEFVK